MDIQAFPADDEPAELVPQGEALLDDVAQLAQAGTRTRRDRDASRARFSGLVKQHDLGEPDRRRVAGVDTCRPPWLGARIEDQFPGELPALQDRLIAKADRLTAHNPFEVHSVETSHAADATGWADVDILDAWARQSLFARCKVEVGGPCGVAA